jgi:hypothetical protein
VSGRAAPFDGFERALSLAVSLLPRNRADWGEAMKAELASLDRAADRRGFALGCVRAVLTTPRVVLEMAVRGALLALAIAVVVLFGPASTGVRIEASAALASLSVLFWWGARLRPFGPGSEGGTARVVRVIGGLLVLALLAWFLSPLAGGASHDPSGWWLAAAIGSTYLAALLCLTARAVAQPRTLRLVMALATAALAVWWLAMIESEWVRARPLWPVVVTLAAGGLALLWHRELTADRQGGLVLLGTAALGQLMIFLAAAVTYAIAPALAPPMTGRDSVGGLTREVRPETNVVESMDPLVAVLVLGALLGGLLIAVVADGQEPRKLRAQVPGPRTDDDPGRSRGQARSACD